ncbi:zinc finger, C3HC4 type (RING finger) domain-containing protein, partial [Toxoplasma gondii RUB]
ERFLGCLRSNTVIHQHRAVFFARVLTSESALLAPSSFVTKTSVKSEAREEAGEEAAACDAPDGAVSPALSFEAPLSSDSEDSEDESSSNSKGSSLPEEEKKRLDEELRRQREWTVGLLRDFVAAVESRARPESEQAEKPEKTEMESSNGVASAMSEKGFFDRMRGALHKLREAARRHRRRARVLERDLRVQKKETLALKVETDRLQKQQALLKYRFRVLSGASPESAASLLRAAGLRDEALEETPGARAETTVSAETASGAEGGPSGAQPGAAGPQVGAPNGPEAARADAGSQLSPGEHAPEKGDTGGDSAAGRVGSGEGSFDFLPPSTAPEEILEHLESLQRKLREREKEIARLQEERAKAEKLTAEVKILRTLNHELILQSSPYVELQQQAAKLEEAVVVRTAEVDELRRELLHEQKQKDEEFEKLLTETKEQTEKLLEKMKTLTDELQSACVDREKALFEGERLRQEPLHRKLSQEEQETVFAQRCVQLSKLKMQHEQLKNAGTQMLLRNERMRKERQTLIEAIRQKATCKIRSSDLDHHRIQNNSFELFYVVELWVEDELICRLKLRLQAEERQKQEGVSTANAASAHEISSSSTPSPTAEKVEPANDPTQNCVSGVTGTSAASPSSSPRDVPRDSLHGGSLLSLDALELPGLEGDAETVEVQMAKMKLEKDVSVFRQLRYCHRIKNPAFLRELRGYR